MSLNYRQEIDGLRSWAVLSVILFHIDASLLPGGFVGVDIFFVISGYLITSIIKQDIENHQFSITSFYNKRIKRILPVFNFVLLVTFIANYLIMLKPDFHDFAKSVRDIVFFKANFHFAKAVDYFAMSANETPLLHTWSLAVEEQYYFIWPLMLFGMMKYQIRSSRILKICIGFAFLSLVLASFLAISNDADEKSFSYYSLVTRMGELLIGSILAISNFSKFKEKKFVPYLGAILIFLSFIFINEKSVFPGLITLFPCMGAALIIYGRHHNNHIYKILTHKISVFTGKISYSLYLWHWPILAIIRYVYGQKELTLTQGLVAFILTFILSYFSWKYIENRVRYKKTTFKRSFLVYFLLPAVLFHQVASHWKTLIPMQEFNQEITSYDRDNICHDTIDEKLCLKGEKSQPSETILAIGDSHMAHWNVFFDVIGKHLHKQFFIVSSSSCSPVLDFDASIISSNNKRISCEKYLEYLKNHINNYDKIIFTSRFDLQLGLTPDKKYDPDYYKKFIKTIRELAKTKKVFVMAQNPLLYRHPIRVLKFQKYNLKLSNGINSRYQVANDMIYKEVNEIKNVTWIDLSGDVLDTFIKFQKLNKPTYRDDNHLNIFGGKALAIDLISKNKVPMF